VILILFAVVVLVGIGIAIARYTWGSPNQPSTENDFSQIPPSVPKDED